MWRSVDEKKMIGRVDQDAVMKENENLNEETWKRSSIELKL